MILAVAAVVLTACGTPREPMEASVFRSVMESAGYEIIDLVEQGDGTGVAIQDLVVQTTNYAFVFGEFIAESYAIRAFNSMRAEIEAGQGNTRSHRSVSMANHSLFEQTSAGVFGYVYRVDNTILYVIADSDYRDQVRELIDRITE